MNHLTHQSLKTIPVSGSRALNGVYGPAVERVQSATQRVGHHLLGEGTRELRQMRDEKRAHLAWRLESLAVGQHAGGVHRELPFHVPPSADGIVVLETEAERIHVAVTGRAGRIAAMPLELLAHRQSAAGGRRFKWGNVARRRFGGRAQDVLQHVLARG